MLNTFLSFKVNSFLKGNYFAQNEACINANLRHLRTADNVPKNIKSVNITTVNGEFVNTASIFEETSFGQIESPQSIFGK